MKLVGLFITVAISIGVCSLWPAMAAAQPAVAGYSDYAALTQKLMELAKSDLVKVSSLGKTLGGREIHLLTLTSGGEADKKPALLVVGSAEPSQLMGTELAVRIAESWTTRAKTEPELQKLLARYTVYIIPRPSPDASELFFKKPYSGRATNERPTDDDRDGRLDEDPTEDLNQDGAITMLRVEDAAGEYMPHPDDPRLLVRADAAKNETGRYKLYTEGIDNDEDEKFNEDGPGGVNFNRNFTFRYSYFEAGAGPNAVSEIETRAVADFAFTHPNIAVVFSFAPEDNLMQPWKPDGASDGSRYKTAIRGGDAPYANLVAEKFREILAAKDPPAAEDGQGSFAHWAYFHYGRWSFASRGWWIPAVPDKPEAKPEVKPDAKPEGDKEKPAEKAPKPATDKRNADEVQALRWLESEGLAGFVPWQAIEHPAFPGRKVEIGGFRPYVRTHAPAVLLEPLAEKHGKFLVVLLAMMPQLRVQEATATDLGGGVFRVTVAVMNDGYLPTVSVAGSDSKHVPPVQLEIKLADGMKLVTGSPRMLLKPLAGRGGRFEHSWVVLAGEAKSRDAKIRTWSPVVGADERVVELK